MTDTGQSTPRNAIVTASYAPDFDRCAILCESIDRFVTGHECHYILVDLPDRDLFAQLEGPGRRIITEAELLPWWLRRLPQSLSPGHRRVWVSALTRPLPGWQMQQIKRIAAAHVLDVDGLMYCDSDTAFVKPFHLGSIWQGERMRLFRADDAARDARSEHLKWVDHANHSLGVPANARTEHDYICQFVTWKRETVVEMCAHMEALNRRPWQSVIGRSGKFSECILYGTYVDGILGGGGHVIDHETLCEMQWFDPAPTKAELAALRGGLSARQVGIGVQSFIELPPEAFRQAAFGAEIAAD